MMIKRSYILLLPVIGLFQVGCAHIQQGSVYDTSTVPVESILVDDAMQDGDDISAPIVTPTKKLRKNRYERKKSSYEVVPKVRTDVADELSIEREHQETPIVLKSDKDKVKISVDSIPLNEFIDLVFANILKTDYTVDEAVKKLKTPVTLNMPNLQPKKKFFKVVKKLLSLKGVKLRQENDVIFISKSDGAVSESSDVYVSYGRHIPANIPDDKKVVLFFPYYYIQGGKVPSLLKSMDIKNVQLSWSIKTIQTIRGKASDVRETVKILDMIDRPFLKGKELYLIELQSIEASNFENSIKKILPLSGITISQNPNKNGLFITSLKDLNAVLVVSPKKSWVDTIMYWKNKMDIEDQSSPEPRFYIYKVKNRKADELADAINSVMQMKLNTKVSKDNSDKNTTNYKASVKFDLATNTIMMKLLPSDYRMLLPIIKKLDVLPLQVLTKVTLAEVTLTDEFSLGFEHALRNDAAGIGSIVKPLATASLGGAGLAYTYNSKLLDLAINAYAGTKILNILSEPRILILNNKSGSINVGTQVPVVTSETSTKDISGGTSPSIMRNISYRNTGINVSLTPTINSNGILTMQINLQLSEAQLNETSGIDSPLIVNRSLTTSLILKSGESIMLGGLISKNKSKSDGGVPVLKDIPTIGSIFKTNSDKVVRTELIMMIKPVIINNNNKIKYETKKYKELLNLLSTFSEL